MRNEFFYDELPDADTAWRITMERILKYGNVISPRGMLTREILHANQLVCDMARPVVTTKERKLNYKFMAAEALWILAGRNDVESLTKHVPRMSDFSDNGETLAGAYGPRIFSQLKYIFDTLVKDPATRQAVLTIWDRNPQPSKDIPCTVSMCFSIRDGKLHLHAYMRSSDAWLGIPYDVFSFSMVGIFVCLRLNKMFGVNLAPGVLSITATSSHLYERDWQKAEEILTLDPAPQVPRVPSDAHWDDIRDSLAATRDGLKEAETIWSLRDRIHD